jgi:uncharacterized protein YjbJ (UPF0337 family)
MITWKELEGSWTKIKGQIQERWGELTDDDLAQVKGNANQLVGTIQQKTGEARDVIEQYLADIAENGKSYANKAMGMAKEYTDQASEMARKGYQRVSEGVNSGVEGAQDMVRRRPVESVGVAFAAGVVLGVVAGLVIRSK